MTARQEGTKDDRTPMAANPRCVRCGHEVPDRPMGCKWPCPNCGFLYPLGDCSD